jgi:hypothetical protein
LLSDGSFIEVRDPFYLFCIYELSDLMGLPPNTCELLQVFLNMSLELCEARDPKGLYKLARAGRIKGKVHMMLGVQNGNSLECLVLPAEQNWIKTEIF